MQNIPTELHLYHFINIWNQLYGKKHRWISFLFDNELCYVKLHYAQKENVMLRIWIHKKDNSELFAKPDYKWTLWKDAIYINSFLMEDKEKQAHFYETLRQLYDCRADYRFGSFTILLDDNKLLRRLYHDLRKQITENMEWYYQAESELTKGEQYWYRNVLSNQPFRMELEMWLLNYMEERKMKPFYKMEKPNERTSP